MPLDARFPQTDVQVCYFGRASRLFASGRILAELCGARRRSAELVYVSACQGVGRRL